MKAHLMFLFAFVVGFATSLPAQKSSDFKMLGRMGFKDKIKQMLSPMGCINATMTSNGKMLLKRCFKPVIRNAISSLISSEIPDIPSMREWTVEALECKYEKLFGLDLSSEEIDEEDEDENEDNDENEDEDNDENEDEDNEDEDESEESAEKLERVEEVITNLITGKDIDEFFEAGYMVMSDQDKKIMKDFAKDCIDVANEKDSTDKIKWISDMELCTVNQMNEECRERKEHPGSLPIYAGLLSIAYERTACQSVIVPDEVEITYQKCFDDGETINLDLQSFEGMKKNFLEALGKIPEVQALFCTGINLKLYSSETGTDYEELAKYVDSFDWGQTDEETKDAFLEGIKSCGEFATESAQEFLKRDMIFMKCFVPTLVETCGLECDIARFLIPYLDPQMQDVIMKYMKTEFTKIIPKAYLDMFKRKFRAMSGMMN